MGRNRIVYRNWIVELGTDPAEMRNIKYRNYQPEEGLTVEDGSINEVSEEAMSYPDDEGCQEALRRQIYIREQVSAALRRLSEDEKEFIERFYYIGQSYRQISEKSGRAVYKLEALHKRAIKKLKKELSPLVAELYDVTFIPAAEINFKTCPLCRSPHRAEIDRLIHSRDPKGTWQPVIRTLEEKYGLRIKTPQVLIGHEKYH